MGCMQAVLEALRLRLLLHLALRARGPLRPYLRLRPPPPVPAPRRQGGWHRQDPPPRDSAPESHQAQRGPHIRRRVRTHRYTLPPSSPNSTTSWSCAGDSINTGFLPEDFPADSDKSRWAEEEPVGKEEAGVWACGDANKEYLDCGPACPAGCGSLSSDCPEELCVPGCYCRAPLILRNPDSGFSDCVHPASCNRPTSELLPLLDEARRGFAAQVGASGTGW